MKTVNNRNKTESRHQVEHCVRKDEKHRKSVTGKRAVRRIWDELKNRTPEER